MAEHNSTEANRGGKRTVQNDGSQQNENAAESALNFAGDVYMLSEESTSSQNEQPKEPENNGGGRKAYRGEGEESVDTSTIDTSSIVDTLSRLSHYKEEFSDMFSNTGDNIGDAWDEYINGDGSIGDYSAQKKIFDSYFTDKATPNEEGTYDILGIKVSQKTAEKINDIKNWTNFTISSGAKSIADSYALQIRKKAQELQQKVIREVEQLISDATTKGEKAMYDALNIDKELANLIKSMVHAAATGDVQTLITDTGDLLEEFEIDTWWPEDEQVAAGNKILSSDLVSDRLEGAAELVFSDEELARIKNDTSLISKEKLLETAENAVDAAGDKVEGFTEDKKDNKVVDFIKDNVLDSAWANGDTSQKPEDIGDDLKETFDVKNLGAVAQLFKPSKVNCLNIPKSMKCDAAEGMMTEASEDLLDKLYDKADRMEDRNDDAKEEPNQIAEIRNGVINGCVAVGQDLLDKQLVYYLGMTSQELIEKITPGIQKFKLWKRALKEKRKIKRMQREAEQRANADVVEVVPPNNSEISESLKDAVVNAGAGGVDVDVVMNENGTPILTDKQKEIDAETLVKWEQKRLPKDVAFGKTGRKLEFDMDFYEIVDANALKRDALNWLDRQGDLFFNGYLAMQIKDVISEIEDVINMLSFCNPTTLADNIDSVEDVVTLLEDLGLGDDSNVVDLDKFSWNAMKAEIESFGDNAVKDWNKIIDGSDKLNSLIDMAGSNVNRMYDTTYSQLMKTSIEETFTIRASIENNQRVVRITVYQNPDTNKIRDGIYNGLYKACDADKKKVFKISDIQYIQDKLTEMYNAALNENDITKGIIQKYDFEVGRYMVYLVVDISSDYTELKEKEQKKEQKAAENAAKEDDKEKKEKEEDESKEENTESKDEEKKSGAAITATKNYFKGVGDDFYDPLAINKYIDASTGELNTSNGAYRDRARRETIDLLHTLFSLLNTWVPFIKYTATLISWYRENKDYVRKENRKQIDACLKAFYTAKGLFNKYLKKKTKPKFYTIRTYECSEYVNKSMKAYVLEDDKCTVGLDLEQAKTLNAWLKKNDPEAPLIEGAEPEETVDEGDEEQKEQKQYSPKDTMRNLLGDKDNAKEMGKTFGSELYKNSGLKGIIDKGESGDMFGSEGIVSVGSWFGKDLNAPDLYVILYFDTETIEKDKKEHDRLCAEKAKFGLKSLFTDDVKSTKVNGTYDDMDKLKVIGDEILYSDSTLPVGGSEIFSK